MESLSNFSFKFSGYGHYEVTYTSPRTQKKFTKTINYMPIIDLTKNADEPKQKHLIELKRLVKG